MEQLEKAWGKTIKLAGGKEYSLEYQLHPTLNGLGVFYTVSVKHSILTTTPSRLYQFLDTIKQTKEEMQSDLLKFKALILRDIQGWTYSWKTNLTGVSSDALDDFKLKINTDTSPMSLVFTFYLDTPDDKQKFRKDTKRMDAETAEALETNIANIFAQMGYKRVSSI
jgi:hypothetical protein